MRRPPAERLLVSDLLALVRGIPPGRIATADLLAERLGVIPKVISTLLANLTDDEREGAPWYRVVAKGGAIGRGPHRDAQFARLVRECVPVSPAGIVQDMARVAMRTVEASSRDTFEAQDPAAAQKPETPHSRSRGMKDRPV